MNRFFQSLFHLFTTANKSRPGPQAKRRTQLSLEALENRLVPAVNYLNLVGQSFTLLNNSGAVTGVVAIATENTTTGAFTGSFTDKTSNELGVVDSIQGQLSATNANIFGQNAATISFTGQGSRVAIRPAAVIASETQSVDFAGRVTQSGNQLQLLGAQDVHDAYTYKQEIVALALAEAQAYTAPQATTVDHNPHEFVSSDFTQPGAGPTLVIPDSFVLNDNSGNYLGELEDISRISTNFTHFVANFVEPSGIVIQVSGQISAAAPDALGGYESTIVFAGQWSSPSGSVNVSFNGRETEVGRAGIALAGELETSGYNRVPIYYYNPVTSQLITGVALVPFDNHEFAYAQEL